MICNCVKTLEITHIFQLFGTNLFLHTSIWVSEEGQEFENFSKNAAFLISSGKKQISPFLAPRRKIFGKIPPWKNSFRRPCNKNVKWHHFCDKLCCIAPSSSTVQQHKCGEQSIAGWQTVHGAFCQTITKSCQITNNIWEIISTKFCNVFFIERFTLSLDPILRVLLKLKVSKQKRGGRPPEVKVGS